MGCSYLSFYLIACALGGSNDSEHINVELTIDSPEGEVDVLVFT